MKKGFGGDEYGDFSDGDFAFSDLDDLAPEAEAFDGDFDEPMEKSIDVTELVEDVRDRLDRDDALGETLEKCLRAIRSQGKRIEVLETNLEKSLNAITNSVFDLNKSLRDGEGEQTTLMKSMLDQVTEISQSPQGTPRGMASVQNGSLQKGGLADSHIAGSYGQSAPQLQHGLTENQFVQGYAMHVRDNLSNDPDALNKAIRTPATERSADWYKEAAAALGVAFV